MAKPQNKSLDLRQLAQAAEQEVSEAKAEPSPVDEREPLTPRDISFSIEYDSPTGEDLNATVRSVVLDADGRMAKTRVMQQLGRGLVFDTLPQEDRYRIDALSRVAVQLKDAPQWLIDAVGEDLDLLVNVNNTLLEHENRYFRGNLRKGKDSEIKTRVRVAVPAFDKANEG